MLGSLPTCAQGLPVLGPSSGGIPLSELVFLGILVALVCGLLFVLSSLAFRKTGHRGPVLLESWFCPLGMRCGFWETWFQQGSWELMGWTGGVDGSKEKLNNEFWLPCKLVWWKLLSFPDYDACMVIRPSGAPGGRVGRKKYKTPNSPLSLFFGDFALS